MGGKRNISSTLFVLHNAALIVPATLSLDHTVASVNLAPDRVVVGAKDHGADFHWLIFKIGNTGTAIYSENNIAWDVQEFGKQRAANERPIKSFVKRVPGLNNLWIVHTEALTDYYTFDAFVEKGGFDSVIWPIKRCKNLLDRLHSGRGGMLNSPLEIQMSFEDDFTECLHRFQCLESGALNFLLCLRSLCNIEDHKKMSPLATCLGDKMTPEMEDMEKLENLSDCLTSRSLVAIDAKWQIDNKVFSFGGKERALKVWIDNVELSTDGSEANRYSDGVTRIKMAAQKFKLEGTDSALEMDFENISYESTNVTRSPN